MILYEVGHRAHTFRPERAITPTEFERVSEHFAFRKDGRREKLDSEYSSFHATWEEARKRLEYVFASAEHKAQGEYYRAMGAREAMERWLAENQEPC